VEIAQKNLSLTLEFSGKESLRYAIGLHHLGLYYSEIGRYGEAEPPLLESLQIKKKIIGVESRSYAVGLLDLASLYNGLGRLLDAEGKYIECLQILTQIGYEKSIEYTTALMSLACTYRDMGMLDQAMLLLVKSHNIEINTSIENSDNYVARLNLAGILYYENGVLDEAEKLFRKCLEVSENSRTMGKKAYAAAMSNLINLLAGSDRFEEATILLEKLMVIEKEYAGENPDNFATLYSNLARQYFKAGDFEPALEYAAEAADYWERCYRSTVRNASRESIVEMNKKSSHFYYLLLSLLIHEESYKRAPRAIKLVTRRQSGEIYAMRLRDGLIEHYATEEEKKELIRIEKDILFYSRSLFVSGPSADSIIANFEALNNARFLIETEVLNRAGETASKGDETENGFYLPEEFIVDYCWYLDFFGEFTGDCAVVYKPGQEED
jgi:tetratricopeptide (TPR) repeat protein